MKCDCAGEFCYDRTHEQPPPDYSVFLFGKSMIDAIEIPSWYESEPPPEWFNKQREARKFREEYAPRFPDAKNMDRHHTVYSPKDVVLPKQVELVKSMEQSMNRIAELEKECSALKERILQLETEEILVTTQYNLETALQECETSDKIIDKLNEFNRKLRKERDEARSMLNERLLEESRFDRLELPLAPNYCSRKEAKIRFGILVHASVVDAEKHGGQTQALFLSLPITDYEGDFIKRGVYAVSFTKLEDGLELQWAKTT